MDARNCDTVFLITLAGTIDDLPVAVFDTRAGVDAFLTTNQPAPVDGPDPVREGPLANALKIAGRGPSIVIGYQVWEIKDGLPVRSYIRRWVDGQWPGPDEYAAMSDEERADWHAAEQNNPWDGPAGNQEEWDVS